MVTGFFHGDCLTIARPCLLVFLTFIFIVPHTFHFARADDSTTWGQGNAFSDPLADEERSQRMHLLINYLKTKETNLVPSLPSELRDIAGWLKSGSQFGSYNLADENPNPIPYKTGSQPLAGTSPESGEAFWFSSSYNHKGFSPMHDAMMLGVNLKHHLWDDGPQLNIHPYVGQNWHNIDNYWGTEVALDLGGSDTSKGWGKIALRYDNGESNLTEHGRGMDMHSEVDFSDHFSLNAGIRQDYMSDIGNYVLLQWKIVEVP